MDHHKPNSWQYILKEHFFPIFKPKQIRPELLNQSWNFKR